MAKPEVESSLKLDVFWLKQKGYLPQGDSYRSGGIQWNGQSGSKGSIQFLIKVDSRTDNCIRLIYKFFNRKREVDENLNYEVPMTSTSCHYGGRRYWFICPLTVNSLPCGHRVATLYYLGQYFGCRHCGNMAYASQMRGGKYRSTSLTYADIEKAEREVKRSHYRGKPTRKYQRLLKMNERFDRSFLFVFAKQRQFNEILRSRQLTPQKT